MSRDDEVAILEKEDHWIVMYIRGEINKYESTRFNNLNSAVKYACSLNKEKGYTEYGVRYFDLEYQKHVEIE
jgi:acyl-ACP thioesterase